MLAKTLKWSQAVVQRILKKDIHTTKCTSLFYEFPNKDGYLKKTGEQEEFEKLTYRQQLGVEVQLWKESFKQSLASIKEAATTGPRLLVHDNQLEPVCQFKGDRDELKHWIITSDKDHNIGYSTAHFDMTQYSKGLFHGYLDTKLPFDGKITKTGYCNAKLLPKLSPIYNNKKFNWSSFTHLVLNIRGDGRVYAINLHSQLYSDVTMYDTWHYFIWTRGGPYWQQVRIPFSKFVFAYKGRLQSSCEKVLLDDIGSLSFTIADKVTGPFHLEIDYIAVENDPSHIEESAYEHYNFDQMFW